MRLLSASPNWPGARPTSSVWLIEPLVATSWSTPVRMGDRVRRARLQPLDAEADPAEDDLLVGGRGGRRRERSLEVEHAERLGPARKREARLGELVEQERSGQYQWSSAA